MKGQGGGAVAGIGRAKMSRALGLFVRRSNRFCPMRSSKGQAIAIVAVDFLVHVLGEGSRRQNLWQ